MASSSSSSPEISAAPVTITADNSSNYSSLGDVLEDLSSRFILNLPESELASVERVCFQVEQAHWFYEDFVREGNPQFPSLPLKKFSQIFFHACPVLHQWSSDFEIAFNNFMQYKTRVPVCGAIMLNDTWEKCVLVKGWRSSAGWGFPKGKINQDEEGHKCAIREVFEETGYDLTGQVDPENVIQISIKQQKISLYIVPGVPEDYPFNPRTRKEISKIDWFKLSDLPTWKKSGVPPGKFYLISPFIAPLKNFIQDHKPSSVKRKPRKPRNAIPFTTGSVSQTDESAGSCTDSPPHQHSIPDSTTQESSSQSSYAGNGLQTPSPEYNQPRLAEPYVVKSDGPDPRSHESFVELPTVNGTCLSQADHHLTRLMESLSLSASKKLADMPVISQLSTDSPMPATSTTPLPNTASSSSGAYPALESTDTSDWSVHAPRRVSDKQDPALKASAPSSSKPPYNPVHIDTLSPNSSHISALRSPSVRSPSLSLTSAGSSPKHQRSISAVSSMPKPMSTDTGSAAKRMKQLALLESVADESARMTPTLEQQAAGTRGLNGRHSAILRPSPSCGSFKAMASVQNGGSVLYTSDKLASFPPNLLKVRPVSEVMSYPSSGQFRQSMNETQLGPMLERQSMVYPQSPPPRIYPGRSSRPVSFHQQFLTRPPPPPQAGQPLHGPFSQPYPSGPISTPPQFHVPPFPQPVAQPSHNANLLSILNANRPSHNIQHSIIHPVGSINGTERN